jgi:WD40 repeat protein
LLPLITKLPITLALVLDEYTREADDYLALHRICAAIEITTRFLTVVTLADVWTRRVLPDGDFPEGLLRQFTRYMERPTLGGWRVLLESAIDALPERDGEKECLLPGLPAYVKRFTAEFGGAKANALDKLLPMRNLLCHGGRISDEKVDQLLEAHTERFETLMLGLGFLSDDAGTSLIASPAIGPARLFQGPAPVGVEFDRSKLPEEFRQAGPDRMLLLVPGGVLDLYPLHAYGEIFQIVKNDLAGKGEDAIHLYSRKAEPDGVEYVAMGSRESHSRGNPDWEKRFSEIFRLEAWRSRFKTEGALERYSFGRRMDELLQFFIARDEQAAGAAARINSLPEGILWLAGKPGMGKSAFMAKLVRDYFQSSEDGSPRRDLMCIPYFFLTSELNQCSMASFAEAAILHLAKAKGEDVRIEDDPKKRIEQFKEILIAASKGDNQRKIVFFVDGIDEIAGVDPGFLDLIFSCQYPRVVWVCAGRDEESLRQRFSRPLCRWLFERDTEFEGLSVDNEAHEGLLPPLSAEGIRGYFTEELGHRNSQFFGRDKRRVDGRWSNEFIEEVVRRSDGLPLYLKLLVEDIRAGRIDFSSGSEENLPKGLEEYYDRIVKEMGDDLSATMPAITTLLAQAKESLPIDTLAVLLADHEVIRKGGREFLEKALRHGTVMLRQAPSATGALGYTLYHASFQQHLLQSSGIYLSRAAARDRLCTLAVSWQKLAPNSVSYYYALRFGPLHLIDAERWQDLEAVLTDLTFIEAKCASGMTYDLVADYNAALDVLPEALEKNKQNREREDRAARWTREIIAYAHAWNDARTRHAADPKKNPLPRSADIPLPEIIPSVRRWTDDEIDADVRRIVKNPSGSDLIESFAKFLKSEAHNLSRFKEHNGFIFQHAYNHAPAGPVHNAAGRLLASCKSPVLLRRWPPDVVYYPRSALISTLEGHSGPVQAVSVTPDGHRAISGGHNTLRVWDLETGCCIQTLEGYNSILAVSLLPDGTRAVSGNWDKTVRVWDLETGCCVQTLAGHSECVDALSVTPDGRRAVSASRDGTLRVWDLETGQCIQTLKGHSSWLAVSVTPDGRRAVSGSSDNTLRVWDLETGCCIQTLEGHSSDVRAVSVLPDGRRAVSASWDKTLRVWDLETGRSILALKGHNGGIMAASVTPDGRRAVSGSSDNTLRVWDLETGRSILTLKGHKGGVKATSVTPDGRCAVSASFDSAVRVWDLETGCPIHTLEGHKGGIPAVSVTRDGRRTVSAGTDRTLRVWDLEKGRCLQTLKGHSEYVLAVSVTPHGRRAVSGSHDKTLRIWDLETGCCVQTLAGHSEGVDALSVTPDGRRAISGSHDKTLRVWDLETGRCLQTLKGHSHGVTAVSVTPDGRRAISAGDDDKTLRVWDLETGRCLQTLKGHSHGVTAVSVTPDGRRAISAGGYDKTLRVWDLETGRCLQTLKGHSSWVGALSVTPDGRRAVSASRDGTLRVWDLETGQCIQTLEGHSASVWAVNVTLDGIRAVSGSSDNTLRVWDLETGCCHAVFAGVSEHISHSPRGKEGLIVAGTNAGEVLFLLPRNISSGPAVVTVTRLYDAQGSVLHRHATRCPACGNEFEPVKDSISTIVFLCQSLAPDQSPCIDLPKDAFDDPRLLSSCPHCYHALKFNPFFVEMGVSK